LVPARDSQGELWNWQRVYSQKLSHGDKFFLSGGRKEGLFHALTPLHPEGQIYICEGFATAASVALALQNSCSVVAAFDTGNLLPVALALKEKYPAASFLFCADNDQWTTKPDGSPFNPGIFYANKAAEKVLGTVLVPRFKDLTSRPTDFNDLHALEGIDEVKKQILHPDTSSGAQAVLAPVRLTEKAVALRMLSHWEGRLIRQDKHLFGFNGTHWEELNDYAIDQLKNQINDLCGEGLESKKTNSTYATFFRMIPHVPKDVSLFAPNRTCGNFLDGTLHLNLDDKTGIYCLHFSEHKREDYLTWVLPVRYNCDRTLKNPLFEALLKEALAGEEDEAGILRALKQIGGAMLVPTFNQMVFLHGLSGSRKSTIALTLAKLVSQENISVVDPCNMQNFEIEGMIGKLVNMHTDIDDHVPLPRGFLKRFEDDTPVQVNRKGIKVTKCMLPRVHLYCANTLPPNLEGQGKAFLRRVTLLEFKKDLTYNEDNRVKDIVKKSYENMIFAAGYEGILNWMLEGLADLVASGGKFYQPASSIAGTKKWQEQRDPVAQFMQGIKEGEVSDKQTQVREGKNFRIKPADLWEVFCQWHQIVFRFPPRVTRYGFYASIKTHGVTKVLVQGHEHFAGIGVFEVECSVF
jgi:phage/plasmid-associated DNA primase